MKKTKLLALVMAMLMLCVLLAACGQQAGTAAEATETVVKAAETAASTPAATPALLAGKTGSNSSADDDGDIVSPITLKGRTVLIIGSTGYEGMGAVRAMADAGMNVVLCTVHGFETAQNFIDSDPKYADQCLIVNHNDGDEACVQQTVDKFGGLDVIISNPGGSYYYTPFEEMTEETLLGDLDHMAREALGIIQAALPYLKESSAGRIILCANAGGQMGLTAEGMQQSASRAAIINMTYYLAREFAPDGITVNCIARAGMEGEKDTEELLESMPLGRPGTDVEFGAAAAYLASEEAGFITGQVINLSGGLVIGK